MNGIIIQSNKEFKTLFDLTNKRLLIYNVSTKGMKQVCSIHMKN